MEGQKKLYSLQSNTLQSNTISKQITHTHRERERERERESNIYKFVKFLTNY